MKVRNFSYTGIALVLFFLVLAIPYIFSDLWMDEVLSVWEFWMLPDLKDVFLHYPIANNHIFFSALLWIWCRITGMNLWEPLLRIPCVLLALLSLGILWFWGKKRFPQTGFLFGFLFAFSPVYIAFLFQLRGYGFSLLLSTLLAAGFWEIQQKNYKIAFVLSLPGFLLLPGIMPSNILVLLSILLSLGIMLYINQELRRECWIFFFFIPAFLLGLLPYTFIWDQFVLVLKDPLGWESPWGALANILLALFVHLWIPIFLFFFLSYKFKTKNIFSTQRPLIVLFFVSLFFILCSLFIRQPSPYPRTYLVFFPIFTLILISILEELCPKKENFLQNKACLLFLVFLGNALLCQKIASSWVSRQIEKGLYPQDLLFQYYQKSHEASFLAESLSEKPCYIAGDFHQWTTFRHYWVLQGNGPEYVIDARNKKAVSFILTNGKKILILASHIDKARECLGKEAKNLKIEYGKGSGMYKLFYVIQDNRNEE